MVRVTVLLRAPPPAARETGSMRFVQIGPALSHEAKRAIPSFKNETKNMNTTENFVSTPQIQNNIVKPLKFHRNRRNGKLFHCGMSTPDAMQLCETPTQAADYCAHTSFNIRISILNANAWWF